MKKEELKKEILNYIKKNPLSYPTLDDIINKFHPIVIDTEMICKCINELINESLIEKEYYFT